MAEPSSGDSGPCALFDVAAYAARVRAGAEARGGPYLLGVDGPGASGKSTLAARPHYHHRLFCRAARALRLRRGLERDGAAAEPLWTGEWMPAEDACVAAERPDLAADAVLSSDRETPGDGGPRYWHTARRTAC
ncbi:hypothetical protein ACFV3T_19255 [Streptomyces albidoflavus]